MQWSQVPLEGKPQEDISILTKADSSISMVIPYLLALFNK
jgi:hypothetical protein